MRHSLLVLLVVTSWAITAPAGASAQVAIKVGGGAMFPTLPVRANPDYVSVGWGALAGVEVPLGSLLSVHASGFYESNGHKQSREGDKTTLKGALAGVGFTVGDREAASPYLNLLAGYVSQSYDSPIRDLQASESGLAAGAAAGFQFPVRGIRGFLEANWLAGFGDIDSTRLFGLAAGVQVPLGGG